MSFTNANQNEALDQFFVTHFQQTQYNRHEAHLIPKQEKQVTLRDQQYSKAAPEQRHHN